MNIQQRFPKVKKLLLVLALATIVLIPALSAEASSKGVTLNKATIMLKLGETYQLKASNKGLPVTWSSDDKKIATVANGLVTSKSVGTTRIKVKSNKSTASCKVIVYQPAKNVTMVSDVKILEVGDNFTVSANFVPSDTTYQNLSWSVSNDGYYTTIVQQVSKNKFKAVADGTATIIAYQKETNKSYYLKVEVRMALGSFHIETSASKATALSLFPGGHAVIKGVLDHPENNWSGEKVDFKYSVEDKSIATIDANGQITALKAGITDIIVTSPNDKMQAYPLTVTETKEALQMDTMYAEKFDQYVGTSNYGKGINYSGADNTYLFQLPNDLIGVFTRIAAEGSQKLELTTYDKNLKYLNKISIPLPYSEWGGFYQGEDGNYYAAVGQRNEEENDAKIVYSIIKMDSSFREVGRCNITGKESKATIPYDAGFARMAMDGTTLIVHTDRERYVTKDGLNHQSNITFMIDSSTMTQLYVGALFPYNHVSHSFNQFVKMDGRNLLYIDHGDGYPRAVVLQTHYSFSPKGWSDKNNKRPTTSELNLLTIKDIIGLNYTGTKVNGFEIGTYNNIVAGVSIPHDTITGDDISSYEVKNVYVSLIAKDGHSSKLIWLTDYKEGEKPRADNLRMVKLSDDKFALIYQIRNVLEYKTGLILINSTGEVLQRQIYNSNFTCYTQPLYVDGSILWIDSPEHKDYLYYEEGPKELEQLFTRIYIG